MYILFFCLLAALRFELRALHLLGRTLTLGPHPLFISSLQQLFRFYPLAGVSKKWSLRDSILTQDHVACQQWKSLWKWDLNPCLSDFNACFLLYQGREHGSSILYFQVAEGKLPDRVTFLRSQKQGSGYAEFLISSDLFS
jgi:hypothetical protein